ncbi:MAG: peptidase U32 family protein, partial [Clostridia bacterium]
MELLAPVGSMESLKAAVYNGANAVYLGIRQFNARNNIEGFGLDNLSEVVDFAHLYGVKVYLALNILLKDDEIQQALDIVMEANNIGVDAFIIQDLGLAYLINKHYPTIELHASTQMAVHNLEGVRILEMLGFKRVVLARETSKDEIKRITDNSNIEIEFFIQGALCVSFSGNCYMCSHLVNKSGNRGICQQFCRLPYVFNADKTSTNGFLLSAKDISMVDNIGELESLGITSLKIEGRARRPFYVAQACKIYRDILDNGKYSKQDFNKLKIAFNRNFTPAYFNGNDNIISSIQGNNGLQIGEVIKVNNGNKFNEVFIKTNYDFKRKCGLKFIFKGEEIASIGAYDIKRKDGCYRLTTTSNIKVGSKVHIIQDEFIEQELLSNIKLLDVDIKFKAIPNQPIKIIATHQDIEVEVEGDICQTAKTISITVEQILKQLSRSDVFHINNFEYNIENCYILNSQ